MISKTPTKSDGSGAWMVVASLSLGCTIQSYGHVNTIEATNVWLHLHIYGLQLLDAHSFEHVDDPGVFFLFVVEHSNV